MIAINIELAKLILSEIEALPNSDSQLLQQLEHSFRFKTDTVCLPSRTSTEVLQVIFDAAKEHKDRSAVRLLGPILKARTGESPKIPGLRAVADMLRSEMVKHWLDGWLYKRSPNDVDSYLPVVVISADYKAADTSRERPACVNIRLQHQAQGTSPTSTLTLEHADIAGRTIQQALEEKGYFLETPELRADYDAILEVYFDFVPKVFEQFRLTRKIKAVFSRRSYNMVTFEPGDRLVLRDTKACVGRSEFSVESSVCPKDVNEEGIVAVPMWPMLPVFGLSQHQEFWVSAECVTPYVYRPELKDKIVLPETHRDLIDVLVSSADFLSEDIVEGKKGGAVVLCQGEPGLGKTLTAEIYSEVMQRPLYRVHSGQLGTNAEDIEKNLNEALSRTEDWNLLLLIDEADVLVRTRGDNIEQNAITSVFLRQLEYFSSFCFMTSNRPDDIDDAILSRCLAVIKYEAPKEAESRKLWHILSEQYEVELSREVIEQLVTRFVGLPGRDIKNLLRLVKRYTDTRNEAANMDAFNRCAMFRGL